jgi:hypothetical protein
MEMLKAEYGGVYGSTWQTLGDEIWMMKNPSLTSGKESSSQGLKNAKPATGDIVQGSYVCEPPRKTWHMVGRENSISRNPAEAYFFLTMR